MIKLDKYSDLQKRYTGGVYFPRYQVLMWYVDGMLHRECGPAVFWYNDVDEWYLNGDLLTREEHKSRMRLK